METIIHKFGWLRKFLCKIGIHRFNDNDIFADYTVSLPVWGISGYCYTPKEAKKRTTGDQWRFRECQYCKWGEFKRPLNNIPEESKQFD